MNHVISRRSFVKGVGVLPLFCLWPNLINGFLYPSRVSRARVSLPCPDPDLHIEFIGVGDFGKHAGDRLHGMIRHYPFQYHEDPIRLKDMDFSWNMLPLYFESISNKEQLIFLTGAPMDTQFRIARDDILSSTHPTFLISIIPPDSDDKGYPYPLSNNECVICVPDIHPIHTAANIIDDIYTAMIACPWDISCLEYLVDGFSSKMFYGFCAEGTEAQCNAQLHSFGYRYKDNLTRSKALYMFLSLTEFGPVLRDYVFELMDIDYDFSKPLMEASQMDIPIWSMGLPKRMPHHPIKATVLGIPVNT